MLNAAEIESVLHVPVAVRSYTGEKQFPLFLRGGYDFALAEAGAVSFLVAQPKEELSLTALRKHRNVLTGITGMECVFFLRTVTPYQKRKMVEYNMPFIHCGHELYLPFLGVVLAAERSPTSVRVEQISFITQKLLLTVLYRHIRRATGTKLAEELSVSCMTTSRCLTELENALPSLVRREGRSRLLIWDGTWRDYWGMILPVLRNPVIKSYHLEESLKTEMPLGGISAVCDYTALSDNGWTTYAVTRTAAAGLKIADLPQVPVTEEPAEVILVMGYDLVLPGHENASDPLTAILSLGEDEREDPRVERAIEQIKERYIDERN